MSAAQHLRNTMDAISPGKSLRQAAAETCLQIPGVPNALAARMVERYGYEAMYLSGAAFSAGDFALPDVGLFTLTELAEKTRRLTVAAAVPLIVDADTGFGEAINVERTVEELQRAGAAAIQLEDQVLPKRCGHLSGKTLVEAPAMCAKLRAAVSARDGEDLVIIARTDARAGEGFDAAVERAKRYLEAGADWIFPEALQSEEEFTRFAQAIDAPLVANMTEFGKSPLLDYQTLADLGYAGVLYPVTLLRVAARAMELALAMISSEGTQRDLLEVMQTREELYELLDYDDFEERDREYFGG
jgi:methylisocitrate lyase